MLGLLGALARAALSANGHKPVWRHHPLPGRRAVSRECWALPDLSVSSADLDGCLAMDIYLKDDILSRMFSACTTDQIAEFQSQKRSFRIYGHSTTIRLERAFWNVLEDMGRAKTPTSPKSSSAFTTNAWSPTTRTWPPASA